MKLYSHTASAAIGICIALLLMFSTEKLSYWRKSAEPVSEWYEINQIQVPDFIEGDDPIIVYARTVHKPARSRWVKEIMDVSNPKFATCTGNGTNDYSPVETGEAPMKMSIFMGKNCELKPGRYIINWHGILSLPGYPDKALDASSNMFNVLPKGAQLYLLPEQVEKLQEIQ